MTNPEFLAEVLREPTPEEEAEQKAKAEARRKAEAEAWAKKRAQEQQDAVPKTIKELRESAEKALQEAHRLEALRTKYPDLKRYVGRWKKVAYCSPAVNALANECDIRHNCGCCPDSPLEVWPFLQTPQGRIYTDPPEFRVGEKHWIAGDTPYPDWKERLRGAGISEALIDKVRAHFRAGAKDRKALAESSDYDDDS
jgi:hypothetical protein